MFPRIFGSWSFGGNRSFIGKKTCLRASIPASQVQLGAWHKGQIESVLGCWSGLAVVRIDDGRQVLVSEKVAIADGTVTLEALPVGRNVEVCWPIYANDWQNPSAERIRPMQ